MDVNSPLSYVGASLNQVAFVVRDLEAAQKFFGEKMGVRRFLVTNNFGARATERTYRGRPADHNFHIAIAYSGDTQIELIQHVSGETCYKEFLERRGEGLHHLGFFLDDPDVYEKALAALKQGGFASLQSGRVGEARYTYFDTEAAIGSIMEVVYLSPAAREFMAQVKRGELPKRK